MSMQFASVGKADLECTLCSPSHEIVPCELEEQRHGSVSSSTPSHGSRMHGPIISQQLEVSICLNSFRALLVLPQ